MSQLNCPNLKPDAKHGRENHSVKQPDYLPNGQVPRVGSLRWSNPYLLRLQSVTQHRVYCLLGRVQKVGRLLRQLKSDVHQLLQTPYPLTGVDTRLFAYRLAVFRLRSDRWQTMDLPLESDGCFPLLGNR